MAYFDRTPVGSIVSRLTNDTQAVADMFGTIFSSFLNTILIRPMNQTIRWWVSTVVIW